jgi:N1-aminopropylagmatine ureohydrolase
MTGKYTNLAIVALPFEATTSFIKGTQNAPAAIIDELERIDGYDFSMARDPFRGVPRSIIQPHGTEMRDSPLQQALSGRVVGEIMDSGGFPLILGGEHTVSIGPIRAARTRGDLGVIQLDAHADLRNEYEGNPFSHACVMRRVMEMDCRILGIGIRSVSKEEASLIKEKRLLQVDGRTAATSKDWYSLIDKLPERVYLSVDMDVFNPEEVSGVGTPEPGGPGYEAIVDFLVHLFKNKDVVAADIVELQPTSKGADASIRLAVRLAGLIVALSFK